MKKKSDYSQVVTKPGETGGKAEAPAPDARRLGLTVRIPSDFFVGFLEEVVGLANDWAEDIRSAVLWSKSRYQGWQGDGDSPRHGQQKASRQWPWQSQKPLCQSAS